MTIEQALMARSGQQCELCSATEGLTVYAVPPETTPSADHAVLLCPTCRSQIEGSQPVDHQHWRCLGDSMWSQVPAVQVMAWRMLNKLSAEAWAHDLLDMLYLEDEVKQWAESAPLPAEDDAHSEPTLDSNGTVLQAGDTVTLIKDLPVKGAGFTAKRGTVVKGISLTDNPKHIEGRVNGVRIVLVSAYLKKTG